MSPRYALRTFGLLLVMGAATLATLESRAQDAGRAAIRDAFAAGDARAVLDAAADRVEVSLFGESSQYSRSQAVYVLQDFFENYPPRRFSWQSASENGEQNRFLAGRYWHEAGGDSLQVHLRLRRGGEEGWQLQEVRIERP